MTITAIYDNNTNRQFTVDSPYDIDFKNPCYFVVTPDANDKVISYLESRCRRGMVQMRVLNRHLYFEEDF